MKFIEYSELINIKEVKTKIKKKLNVINVYNIHEFYFSLLIILSHCIKEFLHKREYFLIHFLFFMILYFF